MRQGGIQSDMSVTRKKSIASYSVSRGVVSSVPGFVLLKKSAAKSRDSVDKSERATTLVPKVAQALQRPGLNRDAVFKGRKHHVYSFSIDTTDTTRVVRVSADGRRTVGRLKRGRFIPVDAA